MKPAKDWISEHGQSGDYPLVDEPVGCFTEAQVREIQWDMVINSDPEERDALEDAVYADRAKAKENSK